MEIMFIIGLVMGAVVFVLFVLGGVLLIATRPSLAHHLPSIYGTQTCPMHDMEIVGLSIAFGLLAGLVFVLWFMILPILIVGGVTYMLGRKLNSVLQNYEIVKVVNDDG